MTQQNCFKCRQGLEETVEVNSIQVGNLTRFYHAECLTCALCPPAEFEGNLFAHEDQVLCQGHYLAKVGIECRGCKSGIFREDLAFKIAFSAHNKVFYHKACLRCAQCGEQLQTGQSVDERGHCAACAKCSAVAAAAAAAEEESCDDKEEENSPRENGSKKRTPRTKFTEAQTQTLVRFFTTQTIRPTRLMREELARKTGLDIRCIQIWFQNKRSKDKRMTAKRNAMLCTVAPPGGLNWYHYNQQQTLQTLPPQQHEPCHQTLSPPLSSPENTLYPTPPPSDYFTPHFTHLEGNHFTSATQPDGKPVVESHFTELPSPPWTMESQTFQLL